MRTKLSLLVLLVIMVSLAAPVENCSARRTSRIEAVKGKKYRLSKQHGPWMIMVASFTQPSPERRGQGLSPEEAADTLVFELRKKGIPAYTFRQESVIERVDTHDRYERKTHRVYTAQHGMISVLAGNYYDIDKENKHGKLAQHTLKYTKKLHPRFLRDRRNGARYRITPGRSGPLAGAFLTINPLLSPEEARKRKHDPLLLKLNAGMDHSLLDNPGKYSLIVASFYGNSVTQVSARRFAAAQKKFTVSNALDVGMFSAWELVNALRNARSYGYDQDFEAYVYHDRHRSVVTIGAFNSPSDPLIGALAKMFSAKVKPSPGTGKNALMAEIFTIPRRPLPNTLAQKSWIFDPNPKLIEVPHLQ